MKEMKFDFKIQPYQTDAVESIVSVFAGQPKFDEISDNTIYARDSGKKAKAASKEEVQALRLHFNDLGDGIDVSDAEEQLDAAGYRNADIVLSDQQLLENINAIQAQQNIHKSSKLFSAIGRVSLMSKWKPVQVRLMCM